MSDHGSPLRDLLVKRVAFVLYVLKLDLQLLVEQLLVALYLVSSIHLLRPNDGRPRAHAGVGPPSPPGKTPFRNSYIPAFSYFLKRTGSTFGPLLELCAAADQISFQAAARGAMALPLEGARVWAKTPADDLAGYELAKFVGQAGPKLVVEVDSSGAKRELDPSEMLEANPGPAVPDLTTMVVLNAATMLHNVRERYSHDRIYTRASNMLVAVNPGHPLPELYTEGARSKSKKADLRDPRLEPHLYDVAEQAFRQLVAEKKPQSIVISGESGAGKTESIKYCMNYLVWRSDTGGGSSSSGGGPQAPPRLSAVPGGGPSGSSDAAQTLTNRIMQSNPLLEAIGCAKTQRNHNSSRFGKYITLQFKGASQQIVGAQIHTFLLEKSRVTSADAPDERSYHVLYYLVAGSGRVHRETTHT